MVRDPVKARVSASEGRAMDSLNERGKVPVRATVSLGFVMLSEIDRAPTN
jgi:hypothetical protein